MTEVIHDELTGSIQCGQWRSHPQQFGLTVVPAATYFDGRELSLTETQHGILRYLIQNGDRVCTKRQIARFVGSNAYELKIVDVLVCILRRALAQQVPQTGLDQIETVWGRGYALRPTGNPYALDDRYIARWTPRVKRYVLNGLDEDLFSEKFRVINQLTEEELDEWRGPNIRASMAKL